MRNFERVQKAEYNIHDVLIAFNNHFAEFGPQSVNNFLKIMNKSEKSWKNDLESRQQYNSTQIKSTINTNQVYQILVGLVLMHRI
jgi:hypothetical protein